MVLQTCHAERRTLKQATLDPLNSPRSSQQVTTVLKVSFAYLTGRVGSKHRRFAYESPGDKSYVSDFDPFPSFRIFVHELSRKAFFTQSRGSEKGDISASVRTLPRPAKVARSTWKEGANARMFDEIIKMLKEYPRAEYKLGEDLVRVLPVTPEGFEVIIEQIWENHFTVSFDGWHEDFFSHEKALACFFLGLSNRCRLKTQEKGGTRFQWTIEYLDGTQWREGSSTRRFIHQFWKASVTTYLQNDLLRDSGVDQLVEADESLAHR